MNITKDNKTIKVTGVTAIFVFLFVLLFAAARWLVAGWAIMLILGAFHSHYNSVPNFSYWASVLVAVAVSFVLGLFSD